MCVVAYSVCPLNTDPHTMYGVVTVCTRSHLGKATCSQLAGRGRRSGDSSMQGHVQAVHILNPNMGESTYLAGATRWAVIAGPKSDLTQAPVSNSKPVCINNSASCMHVASQRLTCMHSCQQPDLRLADSGDHLTPGTQADEACLGVGCQPVTACTVRQGYCLFSANG